MTGDCIVAVIEEGAAGQRVLRSALRLARWHGLPLEVVHVLEHPASVYADESASHPLHADIHARQRVFPGLQAICTEEGFDASHIHMLNGDPAAAVLQFAAGRQPALLVLGNCIKHKLRRIFGCPTSAIIADAPCDVYAVKVPDG
jgi:nucleotide-binding universal stress UspA family protein